VWGNESCSLGVFTRRAGSRFRCPENHRLKIDEIVAVLIVCLFGAALRRPETKLTRDQTARDCRSGIHCHFPSPQQIQLSLRVLQTLEDSLAASVGV
jgi:hypothetical protein